MTDHSEEQAMELEALEAIWPTEFRPLDPEEPLPPDWPAEPTIYSVDLSPAAEGEDPDDYPFRMQLLFQHTDRYPEEPPRLKVKSVKGLTDADVATVKEKVDGLVEENIGLAMIYTLAEAVKEWLRDKANVPVEEEEEDPEAAKARRGDAGARDAGDAGELPAVEGEV
uniref:Rwd domain-containing protein 1-like n=1 Tax=Tetraselmis sp. GSL018 TaxID=582737 RepID=A0A061QVZ4_9CHLO